MNTSTIFNNDENFKYMLNTHIPSGGNLKKKLPMTTIAICILILTITMTTINVTSQNPDPTTTVSVHPKTIKGPPPSLYQTFTIYINVENITDLYSYGIGLSWNPTVLKCLSWTYNTTFFPTDLAIPGTIDNVAGTMDPGYGATMIGPTGVNGSGTLADIKFQVMQYGESWINITICDLLNSTCYTILRNLVNGTFLLPMPLPPRGPTAKFTYSPLAPRVNETVTFDASTSLPGFNNATEENVPIANYTWRFGDGSPVITENDPVITHNYTAVGTYTVNLTVMCQNDPVLIATGLTSNSKWQQITILPPISTVFTSPTSLTGPPPEIGETFTIYINTEDVVDLYTYGIGLSWNSSVLECLSWTYNKTFFPTNLPTPGTIDNIAGRMDPGFSATLTGPTGVTGDGTLADIKFRVAGYGRSWINFTTCDMLNSDGSPISRNLINGTFEVSPLAPVARFDYSPPSPKIGEIVTFNASASTPNGGEISNYAWNFGDQNTTTTTDPIIIHTYTAEGTYTVTLNITDTEGLWNTTSKPITVSAPIVVHDVAVTGVTPSPTEVTIGETVSITVIVKNNGSTTETFYVAAYYNTTGIDTQTVTDLAAGAEKTLNFTWNTTNVEAGTYTIKAVAETVNGETETDDNTLIDDTVTVKEAPIKKPFPWIWIVIGVVAIVVIVVVAYIMMHRKPK